MTTELSKTEPTLDFLLISNFNLSNLAALLSKDEELPTIRAATAPFGQVMQLLLEPASELWSNRTEGVVIWTSPESVSPSYKRLLGGEEPDSEELVREVDDFCNSIKAIPSHVKYIFVPSWLVGPFENRMGLLDMDTRYGLSLHVMRMNLRLVEGLQNDSRIFVLDAARWVAVHGEKSFSQRLWYLSKTPFGFDFLRTAAAEIKAAVRALTGEVRKLLLVDLDETLWGGVVGDVGWQNIRLGGIDPIGEAFRDFQLALKGLKRRGVLLGIVSKNEESTALEAIRLHPEMVLRQDDFAGWRINWEDKAQNIINLASELNLGLQSVVFIDDSPVERARVREVFEEVLIPEWPSSPMDYTMALHHLHCFPARPVSLEDRRRTEMYVTERKRREVRAQVASLEQWLKSLDIRVKTEPLSESSLERATQLFNKTNQMNLSTRRLTREELWDWSQKPGQQVIVFRASDRFGDYGLVGLVGISLQSGKVLEARLVDFILSCRAMGRKIEETMLHVAVASARAVKAKSLQAEYVPTSKNQPCLAFFENSDFAKVDGATTYGWNAERPYSKPAFLKLTMRSKNGLQNRNEEMLKVAYA
ncbi:MAG TPA: HAD-IIIC family phosphatase [Pyrinomonadaceae bacterium]|jgi:HAD-superfamily phosphatase, subfamily IIIC/FkbH-like domain|nr:HAD-IIIC family phosphatase [Pyrinomonadaceae bacterium]